MVLQPSDWIGLCQLSKQCANLSCPEVPINLLILVRYRHYGATSRSSTYDALEWDLIA